MASYRKKSKHLAIGEQAAEALVPFKDDLALIKNMMHEVNETEAATKTEVRQLKRETASSNSKGLATAESQINLDLTVSIEKLKSPLEKAEAIKKILIVNEKKLGAENKLLQQRLETPKSGIYVCQDVYRCHQAILAAFKKQKNAEKVRRQVAVDMAEPVVQQRLDEVRRMLNVDTPLSMNGEAQVTEAQLDGAHGEATPYAYADFLDELEDLWLEELATAGSHLQIEGLQELDPMQSSISQKQEQELQHEARKQEQELWVREQEFHAKEQEFQSEAKKQTFLREKRDKQLAAMQDGHIQQQEGHELHMTQQRNVAIVDNER